MDGQFLSLMGQRVQVRHRTGQDAYRKPTYGDPEEVRAVVAGQTKQLLNTRGETVTSSLTVVLERIVGVGLDDQLILPDGSTPRLLATQVLIDQNGRLDSEVLYV